MARKNDSLPRRPYEDPDTMRISLMLTMIYAGETAFLLQEELKELHTLKQLAQDHEPAPELNPRQLIEIQCYKRFRDGFMTGETMDAIVAGLINDGFFHKYLQAYYQQENNNGKN